MVLLFFYNFCQVYPKVMYNNTRITSIESGLSAAENDRENYNTIPLYKKAMWYIPTVVSMILKILHVYYFYSMIPLIHLICVLVTLSFFDFLALAHTQDEMEILASNSSSDTRKSYFFWNSIPFLIEIFMFFIDLFVAYLYQKYYYLQ